MPLPIERRKALLPRGAQKQVSNETGEDEPFVSLVLRDKAHNYALKRVRHVQVRLARKMGKPVDVVFGNKPDLVEQVDDTPVALAS